MTTYRAMQRLNLTDVKPEGWLHRQLEIQMAGLSGKLYTLWDSVGSYSGWMGGSGESWERTPYYLDGLLPLSYYLGDEERMALCNRFIDWTLSSQDKQGNFGPLATKQDYWSRYAMLKVLVQFCEITGDERVIPFMLKYFAYIAKEIETRPLAEWSKARVPDLLYCMKWAYEMTGDERIPVWAKKLDQASFDWIYFMEGLPFPRPAKYYISWKDVSWMEHGHMDQMMPYHATHIVNIAMGVKHPAMHYAFTGDSTALQTTLKGLQDLKRCHGVVSGCVNGDEHLAGNDPAQGTELCSVVEAMFSLMTMVEAFGTPALADEIERLAYNALPATISEDWMAHQYLQQANQVQCTDESRPWFNNGSDANIFGLEPNFGCCTANMHQGWPKFVDSLWYRQDDALVSMVYAPGTVTTRLPGGKASVRLETEYPFRDTLTYRVMEAPADGLTLKLRVPGWCDAPELNGKPAAAKDSMIVCEKLTAGMAVTLRLPMQVKTSRWFHNSVAMERGPLVYGLDIKEKWEPYRTVAGVTDYQLYAETPWNYALAAEEAAKVEERPVGEVPFAHAAAPVRLTMKARRLADWVLEGGNTTALPQSPVETAAPLEDVTLIPFGCTRLRISQFPACKA